MNNNHFSNYNRIYLYADGYGGYGLYENNMINNLMTDLTDMNSPASGNTATTADHSSFFDTEWIPMGALPVEIGTGGKNLSDQFTTDKAENTRPAAGLWTVGAYQIP